MMQTPNPDTEPVYVNLLRSPGMDFQPGGPVRQPYLTYRPARLYMVAESIPGLLKIYKFELWSGHFPPRVRICVCIDPHSE